MCVDAQRKKKPLVAYYDPSTVHLASLVWCVCVQEPRNKPAPSSSATLPRFRLRFSFGIGGAEKRTQRERCDKGAVRPNPVLFAGRLCFQPGGAESPCHLLDLLLPRFGAPLEGNAPSCTDQLLFLAFPRKFKRIKGSRNPGEHLLLLLLLLFLLGPSPAPFFRSFFLGKDSPLLPHSAERATVIALVSHLQTYQTYWQI